MSDSAAMLHIEGVRKSFGAITAVDDLSLSVGAGEVVGLLGPNGAGKTTAIRLITGLLRPERGVVFLNQRPPHVAEARCSLGVAPQQVALYEDLSANANVRLFARLYGLRGAALRRATREVLERVGLADRARDRVSTFSGGMQRRLNLAIALVHRPRIVLLDEPTVGVDPQSRDYILRYIGELRDAGCAVLFSTHYMEEAQRLCDRVAIIDRGRLLTCDAVPRLLAAHGGSSVITVQRVSGDERFESSDPKHDLARFLQADDVVGVHIERASLESVFLNLTGRSLRD